MSNTKVISEIGEFALIENIKKKLRAHNTRSIIVGIGDDAAVIKNDKKTFLVATTDILIEGVHFYLRTTTPYNIGWKAMAVNLSDIAAMGAIPQYGLVVLGIPVDTPVETVDNLIDGILDLAKKFKVFIIGGDTVSSPRRIVVNLTLLGIVNKNQVLKRSGAKKGDKIMVTGTFGDSSAGLDILKRKKLPLKYKAYQRRLVDKHLKPYPRIEEARLIAKMRLANSMIDCSDGLGLSLKFICQLSKVGANILLHKIPVSSALRCFCDTTGNSPLSFSLYGGEDYELIFTVSPGNEKKAIENIFRKTGTKLTCIGEIVSQKEGINLFDAKGRKTEFHPKGYEHLKSL